jgi:hypothetical protein
LCLLAHSGRRFSCDYGVLFEGCTRLGAPDRIMLTSEFLAEFKRVTEAGWHERQIIPHIYGFQFQQGTRWNPGLSEDKIAEYEKVLGVSFPHDFRAFLRAMNGTDLPTLNIYGYRPEPPHTSVGVYSYPRDIELVKDLMDEATEEVLEHRAALTANLAAENFDLTTAISLVPVYEHRYLVCTEDLSSSAVLSLRSVEDAAVYGRSLEEYLQREFVHEPQRRYDLLDANARLG